MSGSAPALPGLAAFELPPVFVVPMLRALRLCNTVLDALFYDVGVLTTELLWRGEIVTTDMKPQTGLASFRPAPIQGPSFSKIDLSALSNPEGCILVVDSARPPFITRFDRVDEFNTWLAGAGQDVATITITGVGSSALGSAAFAWNASMALGQRVAAIVPGYGVADVVTQALGGWFAFGMHDWIASMTQTMLAHAAPNTARIGRALLGSTPRHAAAAETGAPVFRTGSAASDVLHAILQASPTVTTIMGHSKGALVISNALRSLDTATTKKLWVATFGCPIDESVPAARYQQYLGTIDLLGMLNSWGHKAEYRPNAHHSTNTGIPLSMPVAILSRIALSEEILRLEKKNPELLMAPQAASGAETVEPKRSEDLPQND